MRIASRTVTIDCPNALAQRQFADVAHHQATGVHRNVQFTVVDESPTHCEYDQVSRQGPVRIRQRFRLDRSDLGHQVNAVTAGAFAGGAITFTFREPAPGATEVTATLSSPRRSMRVLGPLLRPVLGRALARALAEDKADLESGRYPSGDRAL